MSQQDDDWGVSGADGWVDEVNVHADTEALPAVESAPHAPMTTTARQARPLSPQQLIDQDIESGKALALVSHASLLVGLPLFLIPMVTRDNQFALHHAKAAAVTFGALWIAAGLTVVTCGLLFPLLFLCYVPMLVGFVKAANGDLAGSWGGGNLGEQIFSGVRLKSDESDPSPPGQLPGHR